MPLTSDRSSTPGQSPAIASPRANQVAGELFRQTSRGDADNRRNASLFFEEHALLASFGGLIPRCYLSEDIDGRDLFSVSISKSNLME